MLIKVFNSVLITNAIVFDNFSISPEETNTLQEALEHFSTQYKDDSDFGIKLKGDIIKITTLSEDPIYLLVKDNKFSDYEVSNDFLA